VHGIRGSFWHCFDILQTVFFNPQTPYTMKKAFLTLAAATLLIPAISFAQNNTTMPQKERRMDSMNQRMRLDTATQTTVNNPIDTTSGTPLNSQREIDLKNGGADRKGAVPAK